eukprot:gnl/Spiro4/1110_TR584_c0_g1_i1.p1 gnl/Spiro4/1110_TR584_c0_g1~~gnl/Spiro4/1110_TR584_c0_g1_i1.p1  ORF type:complete len:209 (+),score=22.29 gnl/Spiro4/1110_TR584_c0_g1_i1:84-710(+)
MSTRYAAFKKSASKFLASVKSTEEDMGRLQKLTRKDLLKNAIKKVNARNRLLRLEQRANWKTTIKRKENPFYVKEKNFFQLAALTPNLGVGLRFYRPHWMDGGQTCYWTVKRVEVSHRRADRGKAWGILTWHGKEETQSRLMNRLYKRGWWRYVKRNPWLPLLPDGSIPALIDPEKLEKADEEMEAAAAATLTATEATESNDGEQQSA